VSAATSCNACDGGTFSPSHSESCQLCPPGHYSLSSQSSCTPCHASAYAPRSGSPNCNPCPVMYTSNTGSPSCNLAAPNYYLIPGTNTSAACPGGSVCLGFKQMPRPMKNKWVDRSNLFLAARVSTCYRATCIGASLNKSMNDCWGVRDDRWSFQTLESSNGNTTNQSGVQTFDCGENRLLCLPGSRGPLCGSCDQGYIYSSTSRVCTSCSANRVYAAVAIGVCLACCVCAFGLYAGYVRLPTWVAESSTVGILRQLDSGMFRICWSTLQIVQSISWNINVELPQPFMGFSQFLGFFSFDFISPDCLFYHNNEFLSVYIWSLAPIVFSLLNLAVFRIRCYCILSDELKRSGHQGNRDVRKTFVRQHVFLFLMGTYLVLPSVVLREFQGTVVLLIR